MRQHTRSPHCNGSGSCPILQNEVEENKFQQTQFETEWGPEHLCNTAQVFVVVFVWRLSSITPWQTGRLCVKHEITYFPVLINSLVCWSAVGNKSSGSKENIRTHRNIYRWTHMQIHIHTDRWTCWCPCWWTDTWMSYINIPPPPPPPKKKQQLHSRGLIQNFIIYNEGIKWKLSFGSLEFHKKRTIRQFNITKIKVHKLNGVKDITSDSSRRSSNWILMSCQSHRVTSEQSNSGH